jgi:hypothetical protein
MSLDRHFRDVWGKLFPGVEWPAKESIALTYMANQILALRGELEAMWSPGHTPCGRAPRLCARMIHS